MRETHEFGDWDYVTNETGLTITAYRGNGKNIEIPDNIYGINVTALEENLFKSNITLQSVTIPETVTAIGGYAFHGCTSLEEVNLPSHLTRIETNTFRYCTSLTNITLPASLNAISSYAFAGCINLTSIDIPDSVTSIGEYAFDACSALTDVKMSKNLNYLGGKGFRDTPWLASLTDEYVIIGNSILLKWNGFSSIADIPYGVTMVVDAFEDNSFVETVNIPNSVTRIGAYSFSGAVNLKNIVIPDTVTRIDGYSFYNCRSLRSIEIPESVQYINGSAFRGCEKLTGFTFPSKVETINAYVLADCKALTDVVIPSSVQTIHEMAFNNSPYIRLHVTYGSLGEQFAQEHELNYTYYIQQTQDFMYSKNDEGIQILLYIGKLYDVDVPAEIDGLQVNRINTAAFQNNSTARRITLPNTIKTIGDWAFSYMDSLEEITLSSELESLGADAFTGSYNLQEVILPAKLKNIGVEPFAGIPSLKVFTQVGSEAENYLSEEGFLKTESEDRNFSVFEVTDELAVIPTAVQPVYTATAIPVISETPVFVDVTIPTEITSTPTVTNVPAEITAAPTVTNVPADITAAPTVTNVPTEITATPTAVMTNTFTPTVEVTSEEAALSDEALSLQATVDALKERNENRKSTPSAALTATAMDIIANPTDTAVPTATATNTSTATPVPTDTAMPTATATNTPTATPVPTDTAMPTATATNTSTATPVPTDTAMPPATTTNTPTATPVPTDTAMPTATATNTPTATPVPTDTAVPTATATNTPTATLVPTATAEPLRLLEIADGTEELTADMLQDTADELTLIIPESVTYIDDSIVQNHKLTIVSSTGTEAERFARKWDLKFLLEMWYEADSDLPQSLLISAEEFLPEGE